jgi:hypothetical protein
MEKTLRRDRRMVTHHIRRTSLFGHLEPLKPLMLSKKSLGRCRRAL